jgi:hypothetical protein
MFIELTKSDSYGRGDKVLIPYEKITLITQGRYGTYVWIEGLTGEVSVAEGPATIRQLIKEELTKEEK